MSSNLRSLITYALIVFFVLLVSWVGYSLYQQNTDSVTTGYSEDMNEEVFVPEGYRPPEGPPPTDEEWRMMFPEDEMSPVMESGDRDARIAELEREVDVAINTEATTIGQCRLVAMGHAPCGGPGYYLPYAVPGTDEAILEQLASQHRTLSQERNVANGLAGVCVITPEPELVVVEGQCTAL